MGRRFQLLGLWSALSGLACTQGVRLPEQTESAEYFVLRVPGSTSDALLTTDGINGADIQVTRYEHALRGRAFGQTLDLYWTQEEVKGNVGGSPVDLKVEQGKDFLRINGLYNGRMGDFMVRPDKLEGTLGACTYSMATHASGTYVGHVTCGGQPQDAQFSIPPSLPSYYPAEIAAHLAVFLGR